MTAKTITAIIGDLHIGSNTAIAPPEFEIHRRDPKETQTLKSNRLQSWLWDNWQDYWNYVRELAGGKRRKHRLIIVCMGDVIDGNHHGTPQIVQEVADQVSIALDILRPIVEGADAFYGIQGTGIHVGVAGTDEAAIYRELGAAEYGQQFALEVDGVVHDFSHHPGGSSGRSWTSVAARIGAEVMLDYASFGMEPPDYIWRGHNHVIDDSGLKLPGTRAICTPSWQLKTEYGYRVSSNRIRSDIGGFIMDGARLDDTRSRYRGQPDGRKVIKVT